MQTQCVAVVFSDFPIIGHTVRAVFKDRYTVIAHDWSTIAQAMDANPRLVIVDVTTLDRVTTLALIASLFSESRVVLCSLHENEVEVYRVIQGVCQVEDRYPSLLAVAA
jgi:DNA-binding NarL/FixJ family response regulator